MAGAIPDIVIRLTGDVDQFIRAWNEAARAAEEAATRIRAAGAAAGNGPDADRFRDLNGELDRLIRNARQAADSVRELGNSSRRTGSDVDELGRRLRDLGDGLGRVGGASRMAGGGGQAMLVVYGLIGSILPGIVAGIFALGAALTGIVMAAGVAALGARGLGQAFDRLQATIAPLQRQLDSIFRTQLGGEFAKLGQTITGQLTPAFKGVATAIADLVKDTSQWIRSSEGVSTIKTALGGVRDLVQALSPAVKGVVQIFVEFAAAAAPSMKKIGQAISDVVVGIRDMFREANKSGQLTKIFDAGAEAIKGFGEILKGIIMILMEMASQGGQPAADAMKKFGKALQEAAPAIGAVFAAAAQLMNIFASVVEVIAKVVGWFSSLEVGGKKVVDIFMSMTNPISMVAGMIDQFGKIFPNAGKEIDKFTQTIGKGFDKTVTDVKGAVDKTGAAIKQGWDKAGQIVKLAIDKVNSAIKEGWDKATETVKQTVDKLVQTVKNWWEKTLSEVKAGVDKVVDNIKAMGEKLLDELKQLPDKFLQAGKDMVNGIIDGAKQQAEALVKVFEDMAAKALAAVKRILGIASPSKVFAEGVGVPIVDGIAAGITGAAPGLNATLQRTMRQLPLNANVALSGAAAARGAALSAGAAGRQVVEVKLAVGTAGDGAMGQAIAKLARSGQLKITGNAVLGGRVR